MNMLFGEKDHDTCFKERLMIQWHRSENDSLDCSNQIGNLFPGFFHGIFLSTPAVWMWNLPGGIPK